MSISKLMIGITTASILALAGAANAQPYQFKSAVNSGNWNNASSWLYLNEDNFPATWDPATDISQTPSTGDTVTLMNGHTITLTSNVTIATFNINSGGTLTVNSATTLTVNAGGGSLAGTMTINGGDVVFSGSTPTDIPCSSTLLVSGSAARITVNNTHALRLACSSSVLIIGADCTLDGSGDLQGLFDAAAIYICPNSGTGTVTLTNKAIIEGQMVVEENPNVGVGAQAIFNNVYDSGASRVGYVNANRSGTFLLDASLYQIGDDGSDSCSVKHWVVSNASGTLRFDKNASLAGSFAVLAGSLDINATVSTSGLLDWRTGASILASGNSFNVTGTGGVGTGSHFCSGSNGTSTSMPVVTDVTCP